MEIKEEVAGRMRGEKPVYSFEELLWGQIYPTDIDGSMDFKGRYFVFLEGKGEDGDTSSKNGQAYHFQNIEKRLNKDECTVLFIMFQHSDEAKLKNEKGHILVNKCTPIKVRFNEVEQNISEFPNYTIRDWINHFGEISAEKFPSLRLLTLWPLKNNKN